MIGRWPAFALLPVCLAGLLVLTGVVDARGQSSDIELEGGRTVFALWLEGKEITQIPWKVFLSRPALRTDLRREIRIQAVIHPADLSKSGEAHDIVLFSRALERGKQAASPVYSVKQDDADPPQLALLRNPNSAVITLSLTAIVRPGKYKLELALFDRVTGRYSVKFESISVDGDDSGLLEQSLREHPKFEFVPRAKPGQRPVVPGSRLSAAVLAEGILRGGRVLRPATLGGSALGVSAYAPPRFVVDTPIPTKLSVISLLTPPEQSLGNEYLVNLFRYNMANVLSVLTRLDVLRGFARFTGLDLTERKRLFDRVDLNKITADKLEQALGIDTSTITLDALAGQADNGPFLREVLKEQFEEAERDASRAIHAFLILGARSTFRKGSELSPLMPAGNCRCRVFYIRFALVPNESDDVVKLIRAYDAKVFEPLSWTEFRDDFLKIHQELLRSAN